MSAFKMTPLLWGMILLVLFARPTHAFGAGNIASISKVEGQNCEQLLLNGQIKPKAYHIRVQGAMATLKTPF